MPAKNKDLHGNVPESCEVALLLIDVINDMEYPGGDLIVQHAVPMARRLRDLAGRAREVGVPVVYVNDNFGRWQSDFRKVYEHCAAEGVRGCEVCRMLEPHDDDYFVLKPKHSGFYSTTLDTLLDYLGAKTLVLTGMAGNSCVLFTASDAFMRDFHVVVPPDCTASQTAAANDNALDQMREVLKAELIPSAEIDFAELQRRAREIDAGEEAAAQS
ncbi:MAG TPA: isochorismatase family cysteine hydrolase [Longimicrobiaceae bacterium]|jgi:nicotinamidase-related amidase|nr:isochorismatase family cysteine hydrolase [Longimicrobiaceae bacterium]